MGLVNLRLINLYGVLANVFLILFINLNLMMKSLGVTPQLFTLVFNVVSEGISSGVDSLFLM